MLVSLTKVINPDSIHGSSMSLKDMDETWKFQEDPRQYPKQRNFKTTSMGCNWQIESVL